MGQTPPAPDPQPLEYRSTRDEPRRHPAPLFISGALLAFCCVGCAGVMVGIAAYSGGPAGTTKPPRAAVIAFFAGAVAAAVLSVVLWNRSSLKSRRWFLLGFLVGVGVACLIEGACYANAA